MVTLNQIITNLILPTDKTKFLVAILTLTNLTQHISGFFSLASIKKPLLILINKTFSMVALLTKFKNGTQR
jgi:hypothetical protein